MKKAYVTGATGCIGRNLIDQLLLDKWKVIIAHRKTSDLSRLYGCDVTFKEVDLYDLESTIKSIPNKTNAIFHVAGNTSYWKANKEIQRKDNVLVTHNLVKAAIEKKVKRFIFTSTGATDPWNATTKEEAELIDSSYIRTKRLAELEVYDGIKQGLDAVIVKPIIVMGKYDYNSYQQIFEGIKSGKIRRAFPGTFVFCHATDVANGHIQAYKHGRKGESYLFGGPHVTWVELFNKISLLCGARPITKAYPKWLLYCVATILEKISYFTRKKPMMTPEVVYLLTMKLKNKLDVELAATEELKTFTELGNKSASIDAKVQEAYKWLVDANRI